MLRKVHHHQSPIAQRIDVCNRCLGHPFERRKSHRTRYLGAKIIVLENDCFIAVVKNILPDLCADLQRQPIESARASSIGGNVRVVGSHVCKEPVLKRFPFAKLQPEPFHEISPSMVADVEECAVRTVTLSDEMNLLVVLRPMGLNQLTRCTTSS